MIIEGFCYHCDCGKIFLNIEPVDDHSKKTKHHIERRTRSQCQYHLEMLQKFG